MAGNASPGDDFSVLAVVERADWIVKGVVAILVFASVWSWAVIFEKLVLVRRINSRATRFENRFWSGGSVDDLFAEVGERPNNPMAAVFAAAMREWKRSIGDDSGARALRGSLGDRIDRVMHVTLTREMSRSERFLSSLATIGSTAPFVGLFGTVWGIMRAFQDIAVQKNTNLATVAPGIAEALFATALGLVAAIPAVVAYNKLSGDLDRYAHRLEGFSGEFSAIVSRELDNSGD
ncbi:MAG: protein TolQ [Rhodospirillaceae bacterium]|nr:protein TolQ [Rhodospirillaceae bacterium]